MFIKTEYLCCMIKLKNNTKSVSKIGYAVIIDPLDNNAFVYAPLSSTKVLGIITEQVPYRALCDIATSGERANVYLSGSVTKGSSIRLSKANDRISLGSSIIAKTGDSPYLKIGSALSNGRGLVPCVLDLQYQGTEDSGYLPYENATQDTNTGVQGHRLLHIRNIESIDVYIATSMRDDKEYIEMAEFVKDTFDHNVLKPLNIRYFDPTLCYCDSRIDKGIIECLLLRSAKVTIYCAQEGDTFGKDSELAATLVQGKPAIVYVPNKPELDKRAKIFKEFHPLGLQIGVYDGVARGVIVVRSPEECAQVLFNTLTNNLRTLISNEQHGIVLREEITNSVVRVMSGWGLLDSSFWNNFEKTKSPKSGRSI